MRKASLYIAVMIFALLLAGCSEKPVDESDVETSAPPSSTVSAGEETETPEPSEEPAENSDTPSEPVSEPPASEEPVPQTEKLPDNNKPDNTPPATNPPQRTNPPADNTPTPEPSTPTPSKPTTPEKPVEEPEPIPKTAYDYPFDIETIKADCIAIGKEMGLNLDTSLTPDNAANWNPITASKTSQGAALKRNLENYIRYHTVENLAPYGIDSITDFNIHFEPRGDGVYSIYFLLA